jgi:CDP-diacylglycerol--glycerol-3-phosphate 3-phosphatidyltransferase
MLALEQGKVIAASSWGKLKTVSQMTLILAILLGFIPTPVTDILSWVTAALTLGSAIDYVAKNKGIF